MTLLGFTIPCLFLCCVVLQIKINFFYLVNNDHKYLHYFISANTKNNNNDGVHGDR